jgi:cytochrome c biogenesis protein CcmG, thiol:disulfide interchange protein DsbE
MKNRLAAALVLFAALTGASGCDRGSHPDQIAKPAPVFAVNDGAMAFNLAQSRGHIVVLNFWATWCQPCIEELPSLMALQKKMPGIQVVAVSIDDDSQAYKDFLKQYSVTLLTVRDGSEGANLKFGSVRVPETFIIDRTGSVRRKFIGAQDWTNSEITGYLAKL